MPLNPARRVLTRRYRGHSFEVHDDGGEGWVVVVHGPGGKGGALQEELRSRVPGGLDELIGEAQRRIDRRLDGGDASPGRW